MSIEIIENIVRHLSENAPQDWASISIKCEIDDDLTQFHASYDSKSSKNQSLDVSFELSHLFEALRESTRNEAGPLKQAYLRLDRDGKYKMDFGYDPLPWD